MNILLTGGNGYVASEIKKQLNNICNIVSVSRNDFDLSSYESTKEWFIKNNQVFDIVIHAANKGGSRLKEDDDFVIDNNIKMYYNLVSNSSYFNKFINLGSGIEYHPTHSTYALSKKTISESIKYKINYFNLRIYGIFNEYELNTRFIKNNIFNYISNKDITIFQNKFMDYIYIDDFISILSKYITQSDLPKDIDCVYEKKYTLVDIANIINSLDTKKMNIVLDTPEMGSSYIGNYTNIQLNFVGLEKGIKNTYSNIKDLDHNSLT
jgi:nucleoside-diphosphate-sugar epimerase